MSPRGEKRFLRRSLIEQAVPALPARKGTKATDSWPSKMAAEWCVSACRSSPAMVAQSLRSWSWSRSSRAPKRKVLSHHASADDVAHMQSSSRFTATSPTTCSC